MLGLCLLLPLYLALILCCIYILSSYLIKFGV